MAAADLTFVELCGILDTKVQDRMDDAGNSRAGRELALARTHLEDAQMRYTRALALLTGRFHSSDLEAEQIPSSDGFWLAYYERNRRGEASVETGVAIDLFAPCDPGDGCCEGRCEQ